MGQKQTQPIAAVSVCVVRGNHVLLVRRGKETTKDLWSLPGGSIELGEPVRDAALRELKEETSIEASLIRLLDCVDVIIKSPQGEITVHYILSVFGARWQNGKAKAGDDASDVQWVRAEHLKSLAMTPGTADLILRALPGLNGA